MAVRLARHAAWVMPGARSRWAEAMRHELDYMEDDPAAVRWALGCILASYRMRLTDWPRVGRRPSWRHAAACAALMLLIGLALHDHAGGQTEPPAVNAATCPRTSAQIQAPPPCGPCGANVAANVGEHRAQAAAVTSCADRTSHEADERVR
jgi:hypothetical protein